MPPNRIAIVFPRPVGGVFSHFGHFIFDFVLPCYSIFRKESLMEVFRQGGTIVLELEDRLPARFGPMLPIVHQIFPGISIQYTSNFSVQPILIHRKPWYNDPDDVDSFVQHLNIVLPLSPSKYGVVIVQRGLDRQNYPGGKHLMKSGADRRTILSGLDKLKKRVTEKRSDTICVELDKMSFAEQVSLFLRADTLIAQHGAALVHSHWMPKGSHIIELQCFHRSLPPRMVKVFADIRGHKVSVVRYPCEERNGCLGMRIFDCAKVARLIAERTP
jgi:hypothetical protein